MKETLRSTEYWLQKLPGQIFVIKMAFYDGTDLVMPLSRPGRKSPNKINITFLTDIE